MILKEHDLQSACIKWFKLQYPKEIIFAVPNAAKRSKILGAYMKSEGMVAGIPDLYIASPSFDGKFHGLFIEMKNGNKGKLSIKQKEVIEKLSSKGYLCEVIRDIDSFMSTVNIYFNR